MKTKLASTLALSALVAVLTGCATPARVDQMASSGKPTYRTQATPLRANIALDNVTGGQETNPMWTSKVNSSDFEQALETSLRTAGLLTQRQTGKFLLTADLIKLDQPLMGLDMTVTSTVRYLLIERETKRTVFDEEISTPYTARFSDSLLGTERLKLANEGSVRENIARLLDRLMSLKIENVAVSN